MDRTPCAGAGAERIEPGRCVHGTRVALEYLRRFPHVRRVVLDGVVPPDMALPWSVGRRPEGHLRRAAAGLRGRGRDAARYPRLPETWATLLASLPHGT